MKFEDRYHSSVRTSNLKSEAKTTFSSSDVLGAAGLAGKTRRASETSDSRPGQPLAMALMRLLTGDNHASAEVLAILSVKVIGKAHRIGPEIEQPAALMLSALVLGHFRDQRCRSCKGHGFELIKGAPAIGDKQCTHCDGTGNRPFDAMFKAERVDLARWLAAELDRELAKAGPAAMAALAPRLVL
jgi:hypothetical protein